MMITFAGGRMTEVTNPPTILVDDAHCQIGVSNGVSPLVCNMAPTCHLLLDARNYVFRTPKKSDVGKPNCVQITIGESQRYLANWKPAVGQQLIDVSAVRPSGQSPPFSGFQSGDTVTIAIGHRSTNNGVQEFSPSWVGLAKIVDTLNLPPLADATFHRSKVHPILPFHVAVLSLV